MTSQTLPEYPNISFLGDSGSFGIKPTVRIAGGKTDMKKIIKGKPKFKRFDVIRSGKNVRVILSKYKKLVWFYQGIDLNPYTLTDIFNRKIDFYEGSRWDQPAEIVDKYYKKV